MDSQTDLSKNQQVEDENAKHVEPSASQKLQIRRTQKAIKSHKPPPTFTVGELLAWKGIWFQLVSIEDANGTKLLILAPKVG